MRIALLSALLAVGLVACWRLTKEDAMKPKLAGKPLGSVPAQVTQRDPSGMTPDDWKKTLTPDQYRVLRGGGTESPGTGNLLNEARKGTYVCGACGAALFASETKYEACDWPSFWDAIPGAVALRNDGGAQEAVCSKCESHLGHLFDDGPPPTGKRY